MVRSCGIAVLQAGAGAANSDTQPVNIMLWQSATLASTTKTSRLPLQRLHKVSFKYRVNQKKLPQSQFSNWKFILKLFMILPTHPRQVKFFFANLIFSLIFFYPASSRNNLNLIIVCCHLSSRRRFCLI